MKYVIRILFFIIVGFISYGFYIKNTVGQEGDKWVGIGVLLTALVLMPIFLWHRYKNKKLEDYSFKFDNKKGENAENQ
ncbi:hypothetical protein [Flavobacterium sp. UBA6135]|jgi:uncharacterized transporter YbjL|uniref:hypothetical protein n=1 Tax=Flavobacterium sp. UBA6135 TaxID=1946553 RepID=UPI0025B80F18|nr:hypothetical protein [Flavobacterium sp. UBA6135]